MRKGSAALVVGAIALGMLTAGCSTDSDGNGDGGRKGMATGEVSNISRGEFIKQANAICATNKGQMLAELKDAIAAQGGERAETPSERQDADITIVVPILAAGIQSQVDEIRALGAPSKSDDQVNAVLTAFQAWVDEASANPQQVVQSGDLYDKARELASKLGLAACAKGPLDP